MENTLEEMRIREISNKKNVVKIILGVGLLLLAGIVICVTIFVMKSNWMTNFIHVISLLVIMAGFLLLIIGIFGLISVKKENEYLRNLPYKFDHAAEYESHKKIGRKKKKKTEFTYFEKYSSWKSYIEKQYDDRKDNEDFYRFMNRKYRGKKSEKELMLNIMIPLDITLITIFFTVKPVVNEMELVILVIGMTVFLTIFLTTNILRVNEEIYFIEDFMELVFPTLHKDAVHKNIIE